jgi:pilus assembly protein CpaC
MTTASRFRGLALLLLSGAGLASAMLSGPASAQAGLSGASPVLTIGAN